MKYGRNIQIALMVILLVALSSTASFAIIGNATGKTIREATEYIAKRFGIELRREGKKQVARFIAEHGDDGIRALKNVGPQVIELTARHGDDVARMCAAHSEDAALYLARNIDEALPVWRKFGKEGTDMMIKHPGLARPLLEEFGKNGLPVAKRLSSDNLERFLLLTSKAAGKKGKQALLGKVLNTGDDVIEFLWKHKWKMAAGATLYTLLKDYEEGFVTTKTDPDGKTVEKTHTHSLIQHQLSKFLDDTLNRYPWIPLAGMALVLLWLQPLLGLIWSIPKKVKSLVTKLKKWKDSHTQTAGKNFSVPS